MAYEGMDGKGAKTMTIQRRASEAPMKTKFFVIVLARDGLLVGAKIDELKAYGFPYLVVCGESLDLPGVMYREAKGKWDAINYGYRSIPADTDIVVLNDV